MMAEETTPLSEPATVGLGAEAHELLRFLKQVELFPDMVDAYRFGIAYAIAKGLKPSDGTANRQTIFNTATLDPNGDIRFVVESLFPQRDEGVYKLAERLAEAGVLELGRLAASSHLSVESLIEGT